MGNINTANAILHRLRCAFKRLLGHGTPARSRTARRLAPLQELEDRRLLSGTPAIRVDTTSSASTASGGASSLTFAHTVNSGSNSILIVDVAVKTGNATDPVTSVTYGGHSLTLAGAAVTPNSMSADIWYLVNPAAGTANVVVTLNGSNHFVAGATDYFGVNQATPLGTLVTAAGSSSSTPSVTVASAAGQMVIDSIVDQGSAQALTASGVGQTGLWTQATGTSAGDALGAGSDAPGAASVAMAWTETSNQAWALAAVPLLAAPTDAIAVTPTAIQTSMAGASASFSVDLTGAPAAPVTINLTNGDPTNGTLSANTLTFTTSNWNVAQTVTVTGQADFAAGANVTYPITGTATSTDANYNGLAMTPVSVTNVDTASPGFIVTPTTLTTSQSGTSASFTVALATLPLLPVTVNLTNGDPAQGSLSQSSLTFSLLDWNTPQTVTVTGLNNHIADGNQTYQITGTASSLDLSYNNLAITPVTVTNVQTDVAGISVTPTSIQTSMAGASVAFGVALTSAPLAPVTINLTNGDPTDGTLSKDTLTFTASNWNVAQSVTVTGQNDPLASTNVTYAITGTATSGDANYNGLAMTPVAVTNVDAGITVTPASTTSPLTGAWIPTSKQGAAGSFSVVLNSQPVDPVTIQLTSTNPAEGTLSSSSLAFTPSDWNVAQTVTVTGRNDGGGGDTVYQIKGAAASADGNYNGLAMPVVTVENFGSTASTITISPTGTSATFSFDLTVQPTAPVTVSLIMGVPGEATLSTSSATFDSANWNVPQTVTVTGLGGSTVNGSNTFLIGGVTSSTESSYNGVIATPVTVDVAGYTVTPTALTTVDTGTTASFNVALTVAPIAAVTINLGISEAGQGSLSKSSLTFTPSNWSTPQTVTVTGLDDHIADGNQTYQITGTASSTDADYNNLAITPVTVTNVNANGAGINVTGSTFLVSEDNSVVRINALTGAVVATYPTGLANDGSAFGPDGSLYVADYSNNQIDHFNAAGTLESTFGAGVLNDPQGVAFGPNGNLFVTNANGAVDEFSPTGTFIGTFISAGTGGLTNAKAIAWGADGNAYVSSYFNSEVIEFNGTTGAFIKVFATGSGGFEQLAFGPDGNLYVASYGNDTVYRYNGTTGAALGTFVSGGSLDNPFGLAFDPAGNLDVVSRTTGTIETFSGATGAYLGTLASGLTNPAYLSPTTSLVTSETGTTATFTVALTSAPIAPVTITLVPSVTDEGSLSQTVLTFDAGDWNVAQTVTVTGLDDHIVHGDQTYEITGTATSSDATYNGMAMAPVIVTNTEADVAGFTVTPTAIQTSMAGASAAFSVVMTSEPIAPVIINLTNGNPTAGTLSTNTLTFDASNWNVAQSVTVTGQPDFAAGANVTYSITGTATSADANYNGMTMTPVTVTNVDTALPGFIVTPTMLTTSQSGAAASFTVALTTLPTAAVTINLSNGGPTQGSLSQTALTFTPSNWNTPQTVTVTGLDDHVADGNQIYQITGTATSTDANYNGMAMAPVVVTNTEADVAGFTVTPTAIQTSMAGASAAFSVVMTSEPIAPVIINLTNGNPTAGTLSTNTLTFDASNWNVTQSVTVTGQPDFAAGANVTYSITGTATSADANYNGMTMTPVTVTNVDTALPGFIVTPTMLTTSQSGAAASFTVALTTLPTAAVTINLSNGGPTEGSLSQSTLIFTTLNWSTPQTVTVTGLNDHIADGNQTYRITGAASSADADYNTLAITPVAVTNVQTDVAGIHVTPVVGLVTKPGSAASFQVVLTSEPTANVTIALASSNPRAGNAVQGSLTFTAADWNAPQTVNVSSPSGSGVAVDVAYAIHVGPAVSADLVYNARSGGDVAITLQGAPLPAAPPPTAPAPVTPTAPPVSGANVLMTLPTASNLAESRLAGSSAIVSVSSSASPSALASAALFLGAAAAPSSRANDAASEVSQAVLSAVGSANRTIQVFSPIPPALWREAQNVLAPETLDTRLEALLTPVWSAANAATPTRAAQADDGFDVLNDEGERVPWAESALGTPLVLGTGIIAASGYVLLNSRLGLWLLGLLTSQPLWKQFDPLEVLYAWEEEERGTEDHEDETLLSLVD